MKKLISIFSSLCFFSPLSILVSCGAANQNDNTKFNLDNITQKNLSNFSGKNNTPSLTELSTQLFKVNNNKYFDISDVEFDGIPTKKSAKLKAKADNVNVYGSVSLIYSYSQIEPSFSEWIFVPDAIVYETKSLELEIFNANESVLEASVASYDSEFLKILSIDKITENKYSIKYTGLKVIGNNIDYD
ncbi:hypothetical protein [Spiroplasma turonicum]|uniref:Lipoprotein n=1 Tax=Spiroplasma turonicum TaxID=216946 RepID=A0A0K1P8E2_9MOLU|nr:hypothetical protein [Spiroplasma turonicum]AKU80167.1 hypothetical protein STURON_00921 [Spiroplasma turonicum]ALX71167.1 hypothetical protein STURO_v1c09160 [Spiroplasma turonicum]